MKDSFVIALSQLVATSTASIVPSADRIMPTLRGFVNHAHGEADAVIVYINDVNGVGKAPAPLNRFVEDTEAFLVESGLSTGP